MEKRMNKEQLIKLIESLRINREDFWILSSSALVIRGIYPDAGDLDIAVTQKGLDDLMKSYNLIRKGNGWYVVNDNVECVLDTMDGWKVEKVGNYYLESIEKYYDYLLQSDREKDKLRIPIVEKYINQRKHTGDER